MDDTYDDDLMDSWDSVFDDYDDPLAPKPTCKRCEGNGIIVGGDGQYDCPNCNGTGVEP